MSNYISKAVINGTEAFFKDSEARGAIASARSDISSNTNSIKEARAEISALSENLKSEIFDIARRGAKAGYAQAFNGLKVINLPHSKTSSIIDLSYNYSIDVAKAVYIFTVAVNNSLPATDSKNHVTATFIVPGLRLMEESGITVDGYGLNVVNHYESTFDGYISLGIIKSADSGQAWQNSFLLHVYSENTDVTSNSNLYVTAIVLQNNHLPYYYYNYMPKRIATLRSLDSSVLGHGDCFAFLTDTHLEESYYSAPMLEYICEKTNCNKIILGGDYCKEPFSTGSGYMQIANSVERYKYITRNVWPIVGNHDSGQYGITNSSKYVTPSMLYSILCDSIYGMPDSSPVNYYYQDNTDSKIRYYMLDSGNEGRLDDDQAAWLKSTASSLDSSWTIVVAVHQGIGDDTSGDTTNVYLYTSGRQIVNALANIKAHVACVICGHMHIDLQYNAGKYYFITVTCDNAEQIFSTHTRKHGTITEQAFDVVHIDTSSKKVYCTRFGGGASDPSSNYSVNDRVFSYS